MEKNGRVTAYFTDGNATLDAANLPQALPTPYLTVVGLPKNAAKNNFSDVFLYNAAGKIAKCADYLEIIITKNSAFATAMIPLVYSENSKEYFRDSGSFVVTFTANVDINTVIGKALADTLVIDFTDGSGTVDLLSDYGYFSGGLKNPLDASPPVIAKGTSFEMNGGYVHIKADTSVKAATIAKTSLVYVYASLYAGNVEFEYSLNAPVYDAVKKGWYRDGKRALYKLVYIKDAVDKYAATILASRVCRCSVPVVLASPSRKAHFSKFIYVACFCIFFSAAISFTFLVRSSRSWRTIYQS